LNAGAKKVVVSAPAEGAEVTVVYGVNNDDLTADHSMISVGSCTTNCLAPVVSVLHNAVGIERGFMTTVHAYTNDQNLTDGTHKDLRRARAAALSMIPTSTGAAKAISLVLPELSGKLDGVAIRVPTPNVSLVDLTFTSSKPTSVSEINELIRKASRGALSGVLAASDEPLVSIDYTHNPHSSIFDVTGTKVIDGVFCRVASWYDNEWGFSVRMLDVAALAGKLL
jgi:glyceraldehyde 3-phosphate dehydrogenase